MASTVSAPGCVTLAGNHALVDGGSIVGATVDRRLAVQAELGNGGDVVLEGPFVTERFEPAELVTGRADAAGSTGDGEGFSVGRGGRDVSGRAILRAIVDELGCEAKALAGLALEVSVPDEFPLGVGLSSSTAVVAASLAAMADVVDVSLGTAALASATRRVESALWDHPNPHTPDVVVRGGVVHSDDPASSASVATPLLVAVTDGDVPYDEVVGRYRDCGRHLGDRHARIVDVAEACSTTVMAAAREADRDRLAAELSFVGALDGALGLAARETELVRAQARSREDPAIGVTQSDLGPRAAVLALPGPGTSIDDLRRRLDPLGLDLVQTRLSDRGIDRDG